MDALLAQVMAFGGLATSIYAEINSIYKGGIVLLVWHSLREDGPVNLVVWLDSVKGFTLGVIKDLANLVIGPENLIVVMPIVNSTTNTVLKLGKTIVDLLNSNFILAAINAYVYLTFPNLQFPVILAANALFLSRRYILTYLISGSFISDFYGVKGKAIIEKRMSLLKYVKSVSESGTNYNFPAVPKMIGMLINLYNSRDNKSLAMLSAGITAILIKLVTEVILLFLYMAAMITSTSVSFFIFDTMLRAVIGKDSADHYSSLSAEITKAQASVNLFAYTKLITFGLFGIIGIINLAALYTKQALFKILVSIEKYLKFIESEPSQGQAEYKSLHLLKLKALAFSNFMGVIWVIFAPLIKGVSIAILNLAPKFWLLHSINDNLIPLKEELFILQGMAASAMNYVFGTGAVLGLSTVWYINFHLTIIAALYILPYSFGVIRLAVDAVIVKLFAKLSNVWGPASDQKTELEIFLRNVISMPSVLFTTSEAISWEKRQLGQEKHVVVKAEDDNGKLIANFLSQFRVVIKAGGSSTADTDPTVSVLIKDHNGVKQLVFSADMLGQATSAVDSEAILKRFSQLDDERSLAASSTTASASPTRVARG